jgi:hypothetical protein
MTKPAYKTVCVVMLTRDRPEICSETALGAARALTGLHGSVLVINNGKKPLILPPFAGDVPLRVIDNGRNVGASARNLGLNEADFLLMLDDDAIVTAAAVSGAVNTLEADPGLGAVAFRIASPDASLGEEACLLPTVFHGCACCFRASALREAGGYPPWSGYYGEEYHVAFSLYAMGYRIAMLTDKHGVKHLRHPGGRNINRIISLNILHNVTLWTMRFPASYILPAIMDTLSRYNLVARKEGARLGYMLALMQLPVALLHGLLSRKPMSLLAFRRALLLDRIGPIASTAASRGIKSIILAGTGKFPSLYIRELARYGLAVPCIIETNPCWKNESIADTPVITGGSDALNSVAGTVDANTSALMTGTSSIPESLLWQSLAEKRGMPHIWRSNWEESASKGRIDLLDNQPTTLFSFGSL